MKAKLVVPAPQVPADKKFVAKVMKTVRPVLDKYLTWDNGWQCTHFLGLWVIVEHVGKWTHHPGIVLGIVLVLAAFKEAYIDTRYESVDVAGNGWKDFTSFAMGALVGFFLA